MKSKQLLSLALILCLLLALAPAALAEDDAQALPPRDEAQGLNAGYYLIGRNGWSPSSLVEATDKFEQNYGAEGTEYKLQTTLAVGQQLKVVEIWNGGEIKNWYPAQGDNYTVDAEHAGYKIIYFRTEYQSGWAKFGGHIWIDDPPTYHVNINQPAHGTLIADKTVATEGETITITAQPDPGYYPNFIRSNDYPPNFTNPNAFTASFTMPAADVTVYMWTNKMSAEPGYYFTGGKNIADVAPTDKFQPVESTLGEYAYDAFLEAGQLLSLARISVERENGFVSNGYSMTNPEITEEMAGHAKIFLSQTEREGYTQVFQLLQYVGGTEDMWMTVKYYHPITVASADHGALTADQSEAVEGETVTLTASPEEGYTLQSLTVTDGETEITPTQVNETTWTFSMPDAAVTVTPVFARPAEHAEVYGASLSLNGNIGLNFYVFLPESLLSDSGAYVTLDEDRLPISQAASQTIDGRPAYRFSAEVPAKEMGRKVTLRVFDGQGQAAELFLREQDLTQTGFAYSVRDYLDKTIDDCDNLKLLELCKAMRDYGACAQIVFGYDTAHVPALLGNLDAVTAESLADYKAETTVADDAKLHYYGSSLVLESETSLRHYFKLKEGTIEDYRFTLDGRLVTPVKSGAYWYVELRDIIARDLDVLPVFRAEKDGQIVFERSYGPLSYAFAVLDNADSAPALRDQAAALYLYWQTAEAFFAN